MSVERFTQLTGTWGARASRWPAAERALYARYAGTPEGERILAEAAQLDRLLDEFEPRPADPLRPARIARAARAPAVQRRRLAWASGAWAASAVLGFALGFMQPVSDTDDTELSQLLLGSTVLEDYL
jgi:hypothetical protein